MKMMIKIWIQVTSNTLIRIYMLAKIIKKKGRKSLLEVVLGTFQIILIIWILARCPLVYCFHLNIHPTHNAIVMFLILHQVYLKIIHCLLYMVPLLFSITFHNTILI